MRRLTLFFVLLCTACTSPSFPGIDNPAYGQNNQVDRDIIAYIDQRLEEEYYWLDEVAEKSYLFDREFCKWTDYLKSSLSKLKTNVDDGSVKSNGQRSFYSYITEVSSTTRAAVNSYGLLLHYTIIGNGDYYHFVVDHVYPDSPAAQAGVVRGDLITMVDGSYITRNNYSSLFSSIQNGTKQSLKLTFLRQTTKENFTVQIGKGQYDENPVAHHEVIDVDGKKIGYISYISFESEYDDELIAALQELKAQGAQELILDLRINTGGAVNSAVTLCSALVPATMEGEKLCELVRNPNNKRGTQSSIFNLKDAGTIFSLDDLTVICSNYSASSSELVVMGLRGLDFPVTLIGSQTEGKNCGMDVTRKTIGGKSLEFAPITFMCFNAKGNGDWGEGIVPDVDLKDENNDFGLYDVNYPLPRADWGDEHYDIALAVAIAKITGKRLVATRASTIDEYAATISMDTPMRGIRLYHE